MRAAVQGLLMTPVAMDTTHRLIYRHRRRAFAIAIPLLASYYVVDLLKAAGLGNVVARTLWIAVIAAAALVQRETRPRLSNAAARLVGLTSGIASTVIVAGFGGTHGVYFVFLLGTSCCVLACIPDLLSCAVLAGIATTIGGAILLAREHQPGSVLLEWIVLSALLNGLAGWATLLYARVTRNELAIERERAQAVEELRAAEERLHAAFSSINLGSVIVRMEGTIIEANAALKSMLGFENLVGRNYFDLLPPEEVDDSGAIRSSLAAGNTTPHVERHFVKKNGEVMLASVHASPIHDRAGAVEGAIVMIEDITERECLREQLAASEALFRDLAERAMVGVYLIQDGVVMYANPRMAEIFAYGPEEIIGKMRAVDLTHPEDRAAVSEHMRRRLASEIESIQYQFRGIRKNGKAIHLEAFGTRTTYCSRPAIVGTLLDVTAKRSSENDLLRVQKLESLGVLAGGIAHDFNNLLAAILGDISVAREHDGGDALLGEVLAEAATATMRARDLTRQLLTFSRGGEPVRKRFDLGPLLESAASLAVRGSRVRCEFDLPADLWPVDADEGQIGQVVHNLVLNAVQAMSDGGVVRISAENATKLPSVAAGLALRRSLRVSVTDTGPGIPADLLQKVFDPYFTTKLTGSGLGLASAHSIIVRHGGHISIESEPGQGATAYFYLPAAEATVEVAPTSPGVLVRGRGCVIVMDDDDFVRRAAMRMLTQLGFQVLAARDGSEMLVMCQRAREDGQPVHAAIMDLTIPGGMGGKEAARLLRQREPSVKAIVSSGYSSDPVMADYEKYGFAGVIPKPYSLQDLSAVLHRVLGATSGLA
jgi:two-component system cell cycle sensor histidine kinase/response regulator CckA